MKKRISALLIGILVAACTAPSDSQRDALRFKEEYESLNGQENTSGIDYRINILFSALSTKDIEAMLTQLKAVPNAHLYLTTFEHPKALDLSTVTDLVDETVSIVSLWQFGLAEILEKMTNEDVLVVTGSLYFISEVRTLLLQLGGKNEL